ncbi:MAG TPA: undecaprenyl-diphosphatase UppP [Candidatus Kapabacteria bacterium]|nr:undecaprenyl-diphosphatase UppP [Candidatus Kapabacteria bacterium]
MNIIEAIILGIIQGLSEFIPISSTAHLTIAGQMMNLIDPMHPERWTSFIAIIQLGTLIAVLVYFKNEIISYPKAFINENLVNRKKFSEQSIESRLSWFIGLGTLPIVVIGLLFKDFIEGSFTKELNVIAISLIVLAIILYISEKIASLNKDLNKISLKDAIIIGFAQAVALIPGSSRSGTTITAGLFVGLNRETAARFSFLLSIPAILASGLLSAYQAIDYINSQDMINILVATTTAAISGYFAIAFLINYLKKNSTLLFIIYRIALGIIILLFFIK